MSKTVQAIVVGVCVGLTVFLLVGFGLSSLDGENHMGPALSLGFGLGVLSAFVFVSLAGNRKIANASDADKALALERQPPTGRSLLFIYRQGYVARLAGMNIEVDGKAVAQLKSPRFTCLVVEPGPHTVIGRFNGFGGAQNLSNSCEIIALADRAAAVQIGAHLSAKQGGISFSPQDDIAAVKRTLATMPMTPPDLAEV